ncbi:hypothetical protein RP20_CCG017447, partial [Aedes albopictus]
IFNSFTDLNIGIQELSTITADELEEALQRTCLSEGYVWNTKQIFDRIYQWQQKNVSVYFLHDNYFAKNIYIIYSMQKLALQTLPKHEQIPADERQDLTGETAASRIEASDPLPLPEKSIEFVKISDGQEKVETSDRSCSFDAGCSYRNGSGLGVVDENLVGRKLFSPSALLHLLNSTELGKDIIRRSEVGELSTGRQHELAGIVAEWHLANRTRVTQEDLEEYAATVTAVFHSEKRGGAKRNPGGIIYNKICNLKAKARKRDKSEKDYAKRIRAGADQTKKNKASSLALNWLMLNDGPWGVVLEKWKESFESRNHFMGKSTAESNLRKCKIWKHLQSEFGCQLIDDDFDLKYPTAKNGIEVWDDLLVHVIDYLKIHVNDEFSIRILHDVTNTSLSDGNHSHISKKINKILTYTFTVLDSRLVTAGYKPTVASAQEEIFLFDNTEQGAKQKLQELYARHKDLGLPPAPKLIALGANYKELQGHFIVCYGDLSYKFTCLKRAVDVYIKLALVLGLQHSKITKLIWLFVVRCVYGVYVPEKYSNIEKLVIHLNNVKHAHLFLNCLFGTFLTSL